MPDITRRAAMTALPGAAAALALPNAAAAEQGDAFAFEVIRSEAEWRAQLTEAEYAILREGATEVPKSDPLWDSTAPGMYACKGCALPVYDARWKVVLDIGFLFYRHCEEDSVLTSIDRSVYAQFGGEAGSMGPVVPEGLSEEDLRALDTLLLIEVHCRRCASHLGHLLLAKGKLLHCINGAALDFTPGAA